MFGDDLLKRTPTDPPRSLPWSLVGHLCFGGFLGFFAWFFLGLGLIFVWGMALHTDPLVGWDFGGPLATVNGHVTGSEETSFSEGGSEHTPGTPVFRHRYRFTYGDREYTGESFELGRPDRPLDAVLIEFPEGRPERSRIKGMRTAMCPNWVLFVVLFPTTGGLLSLFLYRRGRKRCYLLKHGLLAEATLVDKQATNTEIDDQTVFRLTFGFESNHGPAEIVVKTHRVELLEDDPTELVLYCPTDPSYGTTLDHLPGRPVIREDGSIAARSAWLGALAWIPPLLTIVGHGTYLWLHYAS